MKDSFYIFCALLRRDLFVMKSKLKDMIIDSLIVVATEVLILGKLYPLIGMANDSIAPLYIGSSVTYILIDLGYSFSMRYTYYDGYDEIAYHLTFPLSKKWIFAEHIVYFVIEAFIITVPLLSLGILLLGDAFGPISGTLIGFFFVYVLTLFFFGTFFFASSFWYEKIWFQDNMWPRRLSILLFFSSAFYTWSDVNELSPFLGMLLLLNPLTYIAEGLRASLLGGAQYLSIWVCVPVIIGFIVVDCWRIDKAVTKRLDPV